MVFNRRDSRRIAQVVPAAERLMRSVDARRGKQTDTNRASVLVKTPANGIPARSGTTLGKADCTIQEIDKDTDAVSDGNTLSVYNVTDSMIAGEVYLVAIRDRTGNFIAEPQESSYSAACEFEFEYYLTYGQINQNVWGFRTQDSSKFYFDGEPRANVPCTVFFTGFYEFVPWTYEWYSSDYVAFFNGVQKTGNTSIRELGAAKRIRYTAQQTGSSFVSETQFSLPHLVGANILGGSSYNGFYFPLGFTFSHNGSNQSMTPIFEWITGIQPTLRREVLSLKVRAVEHKNSHVIN